MSSAAAAASAVEVPLWHTPESVVSIGARDLFMLAHGPFSSLRIAGAPHDAAIRRVATQIQSSTAGERRLCVNLSVPQKVFPLEESFPYTETGAIRATKLKHDAPFTNGAAFDHARVGYQLVVDNIHVMFMAEAALSKSTATVCDSSVCDECVVVAIHSTAAREWAEEQRSDRIVMAEGGYADATVLVRCGGADAAYRTTEARLLKLDQLVTEERVVASSGDWRLVRDAFSLAERMLRLQREFVCGGEVPQSRLFVVPVNAANDRACRLLSVALALTSATYFASGKGPLPKVTIGDVTAVTNGFWRQMASKGGVPHPADCFTMDGLLLQALQLNMRSMVNRNHSGFEVLGKARSKRLASDLQCFCCMTPAFIAHHALFWPGSEVVLVPDVDLTGDSLPVTVPHTIKVEEEEEEEEDEFTFRVEPHLFRVQPQQQQQQQGDLAFLAVPLAAALLQVSPRGKRKEIDAIASPHNKQKTEAVAAATAASMPPDALVAAFAAMLADFQSVTPHQHRAIALVQAMQQAGEAAGLRITIERADAKDQTE